MSKIFDIKYISLGKKFFVIFLLQELPIPSRFHNIKAYIMLMEFKYDIIDFNVWHV